MSEIIVTDDIDKIVKEIKADEVFIKDEFRVDDVREVIQKAYIKDTKKRVFLLAAKKYNIFAQNALLKLLEEELGVEFILVTPSKYSLLDTIKSRLPIKEVKFNTKKEKKKISLKNEDILKLLKEDLEKDDIKEIIYSLIDGNLDEEQLEILSDALKMLELNIDKKAILSLVILAIKDKR